MSGLSARLAEVVDALPLREGMAVLEVGCGPGAAAREVAARIGRTGYVVAVDRSPKAISQLEASAPDLVAVRRLVPVCLSVEDLRLPDGVGPFDLGFAVRVGALDGRHPAAGRAAVRRLAEVMKPGAPFLVDGGTPLRPLELATP